MTHYPNHCIHQPDGPLCPQCRVEADADPDAWSSHGNHLAGLAERARTDAEMEAVREELETPVSVTDEIPF